MAFLLALLAWLNPAVAADTPPNVLLVLVDAMRARNLSVYGYARPTTPNLERFARRAVVFEHCVSQAAWTVPAVASLYAGVDPLAHGVLRYNPTTRLENDELMPWEDTIAEVFQRGGWQTAALQKSVIIDPRRGMTQGFDLVRIVGGDMVEGESAGQLTDDAIRWLRDERDPARPFFLNLHYMDPHSSYRPPEPWYSQWADGYAGTLTGEHTQIEQRFVFPRATPAPEDLARLLSLYDGEIGYWDQEFGRLMAHLVTSGLDANTVVVVVADHGEAFGEHGSWFQGDIFQENVEIPLLVKAPGVEPGRRSHWTQLIDVAPTLADLVGLPRGARWMGRSQAASVRGGPAPVGVVYAEYGNTTMIVRPDGMKLMLGEFPARLYNLRRDPLERHDLGPVRALRVEAMKPELHARRRLAMALAGGGS